MGREQVSKHEWWMYAQRWELGWWTFQFNDPVLQNEPRHHPLPGTGDSICEALEMSPELFWNAQVLDVGCGPTGRLKSRVPYKGPKGWWVALDPLLRHYRAIPGTAEHLEGYDEDAVFPMEERQEHLVDRFDMIVSINALDHGFDLLRSLQNVAAYLRKTGLAVLSFDCFDEEIVDLTHPIRVSAVRAEELMNEAGLRIVKTSTGACLPGQTSWGGGTHHHWWCKKG
jgi:SAM-dependent methyltransferase